MGSGRRIVDFVALDLFVQLFLADQTLVASCEVVVREELGKQQVHIGALMACLRIMRVPDLGSTAGIGCHLRGEVLDVDVVCGCTFCIVGDTLAFAITNEIVGSMLDLRRCPTLGFETVIAHAKHLASEGLSHDGLT